MNPSNVLYANHQNDIAASALCPHKYDMDVGAQSDRKTNLGSRRLAGRSGWWLHRCIDSLKDLIECLPLSNCSKQAPSENENQRWLTHVSSEQASQPPILIPIPRSVHGATFCSGVTLVGREKGTHPWLPFKCAEFRILRPSNLHGF